MLQWVYTIYFLITSLTDAPQHFSNCIPLFDLGGGMITQLYRYVNLMKLPKALFLELVYQDLFTMIPLSMCLLYANK